MDLPLILEERKTVSGVVEKNQEIYCCLKQVYGTILHDTNKGNNIPIHTTSMFPISDAIESSLNNIKDISDVKVKVSDTDVYINYVFQGTKQLFIIPKQDVTG